MMKVARVDEASLQNGISYWWANPTWNKDFHNELYRGLIAKRREGFSVEYWNLLVDELCRWRANRPMEKSVLSARGLERLRDLEGEFGKIRETYGTDRPEFESLRWEELKGMFEVAREIKGNLSPVFASKLCHLILPGGYVVIDNVFIGVEERYESYWKRCQKAWQECRDKEELKEALRAKIGRGTIEGYPWATKITELCLSAQR